MKNLDIKKTEKTFNNLIISSNKNDNSKFDLCCYIIEIVFVNTLNSKQLETHLSNALFNVTKGKHFDCLNENTIKRLKSLCCNKRLMEQIKKAKPTSVKSFLNSFNIDTQNLLQVACYTNGIFSSSEVKEKDTKKLYAKKLKEKKESRKPSGQVNQNENSDKVNFNTKNVEKNIQNALLTLKTVIDNPELKSHAFITKTLMECLLNKDKEQFNIHFDNYVKNGTKSK